MATATRAKKKTAVDPDAPQPRRCLRCDAWTTHFRSPKALRCTDCDSQAKIDRQDFERRYHRARARAVSKLIAKHQEEFTRLKDREMNAIMEEENGVKAS